MILRLGARLLAVLLAGGCTFTVGAGASGDGPHDGGRDPDAPGDGPTADASPCRAVEVSAQSAHTCARMETGDVWCWGINDRGQVGRPVQDPSCHNGVACNATPEKLALPAATRLGVSEEHACAIAGGDVYCWGRNVESQFGTATGMDAAAPIAIPQRAGATQVGGGLTYGCSLQNRALMCSGMNSFGEVGNGSQLPAPTPVATVPSGTDQLAAGYDHACALEGGFVYCWGNDTNGQVDTHIGAGAVLLPTIVQNVGLAVSVASGFGHTCAALDLGGVRCWGANGIGQLGAGDTTPHIDQVATAQVSGIVDVSAGADHTCARTPLGNVFCWGEHYGATPVAVALPHPAVSIASGSYHDCFALDDGSVYCLGWNAYGQLGLGTAADTTTDTVSQVRLCP